MKIQINNIRYNFIKQGSDHLPDDENLGLAHLIIPGSMADRFRRECGHDRICVPDGRSVYPFPHYDEYDMQDVSSRSEHNCFNADTQIVLMNWLFEKKRTYHLDYYGLDPYWLFHDACHAESDVMGYAVWGINSYTEWTRLLEGAEFAKKHNISMKAETLILLENAWRARWKYQEGSRMTEFKPTELTKFMSQRQAKIYFRYQEFN